MAMEKGDLCKASLSPSHSLVPAMPQQDPFPHLPTLSLLSPGTALPTLPFQTHLAQDELNFLEPLPQTRDKESLSPVGNTNLASAQAFFKGAVFAVHLL